MVARTPTRKSSKKAVAASMGADDPTLPGAAMDVPDPVEEATGGVKKKSAVQRSDGLDVPEPRRKLVTKLQQEIRADKKYFENVFKRMREDMEYARLGADLKWVKGDNYTVPIINRFLNSAVASLYAKSPKAQAKRKPKMMFKEWDGTQESAKAAMTMLQSGMDATGQAGAILQEIHDAKIYNQMVDRIGKTMEILFEHYTGEDYPDFKKQMKQLVRRTKTCGVGYIKPVFHRAFDTDPDITARIGDITSKIQRIESLQADEADGLLDSEPEKLEELQEQLRTLQEEQNKIAIEGLMFDFPRSLDIIPHRKCRELSGFIGCDYITHEVLMDTDEIQESLKIDVKNNYKVYVEKKSDNDTAGNDQEGDRGDNSSDSENVSKSRNRKDAKGKACVWFVQNKKNHTWYVLIDGYPDYAKEPSPPDIEVNGFWTIFSLIFNAVEDEKEVFPPSDVHHLKHPQREYNNARQGMREHRKANRPKYFAKSGALEEAEKKAIESAPAHAVIELKGIEANVTIDQLIQPYKGVPLDPALYDTGNIVKDILYGVGAQEASFGQTSGDTATETSIAENSRMSTLSSNVDDLDGFLSELARACGQIMLRELSADTVQEIVGPGAVWPVLTADNIMKELFLQIKAGSSGRPNQAAELAKLERGLPFLLQLGSVNPTVLGKKYADLLDLDPDELIVEGLPSITTINAIAVEQARSQAQAMVGQQQALPAPAAAGTAQPATGNAATEPTQQGSQGAQNAPGASATSPQGQPEYTPAIHRYDAKGARIQ